MIFVPVVTPPPMSSSPRTRELAGLLAKVLDEYTKAHPAVTGAEVRAAVRMALMSAGPSGARAGPLIALTLGVLIAVVGTGVFFFFSQDSSSIPPVSSAIIMGVVILLGIVVLAVKVQSR